MSNLLTYGTRVRIVTLLSGKATVVRHNPSDDYVRFVMDADASGHQRTGALPRTFMVRMDEPRDLRIGAVWRHLEAYEAA